MELTFDQIKPFLSERGQLEVELAALRATAALQGQVIAQLQDGIDGTAAEVDPTVDPSAG